MAFVRATPQFLVGTSGVPELGIEFGGVQAPLNMSRTIAQIGIPFLIMPGDGGANGCSFSGAAGAFTLSASILPGSYPALAACHCYLSDNFGGSSYTAGWYYAEFSSETAGVVYLNQYTSGVPRRPATKTAFPVNLSGRVTASTSEITAANGFRLPAGSLGKNGSLLVEMQQLGSTTGNKTFRVRCNDAGTTNLVVTGTAASPATYSQHLVGCADSHTEKYIGRASTSLNSGVGGTSTSLPTSVISVNTAQDVILSFTMIGSSNLSAPCICAARITANYGE